jgi:hypothetical protein
MILKETMIIVMLHTKFECDIKMVIMSLNEAHCTKHFQLVLTRMLGQIPYEEDLCHFHVPCTKMRFKDGTTICGLNVISSLL